MRPIINFMDHAMHLMSCVLTDGHMLVQENAYSYFTYTCLRKSKRSAHSSEPACMFTLSHLRDNC